MILGLITNLVHYGYVNIRCYYHSVRRHYRNSVIQRSILLDVRYNPIGYWLLPILDGVRLGSSRYLGSLNVYKTLGLPVRGSSIMQRFIFLSLLVVITFFIKSDSVFASQAFTQTVYSYESTVTDGRQVFSGYLTASSTGQLTQLCIAIDTGIHIGDYYYKLSAVNTTQSKTALYATTTATYGYIKTDTFDGTPNCYDMYYYNGSTYYGNGFIPIAIGDQISWTIDRIGSHTQYISVLGSNATSSPTHGTQLGACELQNPSSVLCSPVKSAYQEWILLDTFTNTDTAITSTIYPTEGTTTASTTVNFNYNYFVGTTYVDKAGIEVQNLLNNQTLNVTESNILQSGIGNFSKTISLVSGNIYRWRPYVRYLDTYIRGSWRTFYVVSNQSLVTPNQGSSGSVGSYATTSYTFGSSTNNQSINVYNVDSFCLTNNVFIILSDKFPFSYICDVGLLISELGSGSATDIVYTLPANIASSSAKITLVPVSVLEDMVIVQQIRDLLANVIWFMFAMYVVIVLLNMISRK